MKKTYVLFLMVLFVQLLLTTSEGKAQLAAPITIQRTCTAGSLAFVEAGPLITNFNWDAGLNPDFPRVVNCPSQDCAGTTLPLNGKFLRWDIRFTPFLKTSPSLVGTQVAADVQIETSIGGTASIAGSQVSALQVGAGDWDSRWLTFPGNSTSNSPFIASYFTGLDVKARPEGVVVKSGNSTATCQLAGAGINTGLDPNQAVADLQSFVLPGTDCNVQFNVASDGKVVKGTMQVISGSCTVEETDQPIIIDYQEIVFIGPVQFTQPGSCNYCWTNTFGGKSCCNCTDCCINKATGKCVKATTLATPSTQCKSGTYP